MYTNNNKQRVYNTQDKLDGSSRSQSLQNISSCSNRSKIFKHAVASFHLGNIIVHFLPL